ncbi:hypothetical protein [Kangiella sp.]|uniref:hypothetical protein n=1 Tax=Kangiella sp. TaxID=1920245 RepID=UPI0019AC962D|nr:hypothetical protein [Kangiella sp.]MBD3652343.1 hypothetical protein [Kangiella sp.]
MKGYVIDISASDLVAIVAVLIAILSALYSRWSVKEAKKANDIGRLNALLSFRKHYLELMKHQESMAKLLKDSDSGMQAVREKYADIDSKLREVGSALEQYHSKVVNNKI